MAQPIGLFGMMAEFSTPQALLAAIEKTRGAGYTDLEAYTPYPLEEVSEALGHHRSKVPLLVLAGGIVGFAFGFGLQYWSSVIAYPLNVGGRPLNSWVAFIPPTFETTILFAAVAAVLGMFALNGLPMPYHPVFNSERFKSASRDRYFLMVGADDPRFDRTDVQRVLQSCSPDEVFEVDY